MAHKKAEEDKIIRRPPLTYKKVLRWIIDNDDTYWLDDDDNGIICVTASLAADIFDRTENEVIADLKKMKNAN